MSAVLKFPAFIMGFISLYACATPGINYTAEIAPGNPQAAQLRTVAVDRFSGPLADWYEDQFEGMLSQASFNNQPWFQLGLFSRQSNVTGVYAGQIEIGLPYANERFYTTTQCVKRDEDGKKCVKKVDIETVCIDYSIDVAVTPQVLNVKTGRIVHSKTYLASDSEQECFETGLVQYRIRRGPNDQRRGRGRGRGNRNFGFAYENYNNPGYRLGGDYIIDRITAAALRNTIWQARLDIAPHNREVRATILTEAENLDVRSDPRFKQAVQGIQDKNLVFACQTFESLADDYETAPAVLHNLGACAEASGDSAGAQAYYGQAAQSAQALGTAPAKRILNALERISGTRSNEIVLDTLVPSGPVLRN